MTVARGVFLRSVCAMSWPQSCLAPTGDSVVLDDRDWQTLAFLHNWNAPGECGLQRAARDRARCN